MSKRSAGPAGPLLTSLWRTLASDEFHERKVRERAVKIVAVFSWTYHRRHIGCGQSSWSSLRLTSFDEGMGETHGGARRDHTFHHLQVCEAHPNQAIPLEGSWYGDAKDYLGMSVSVTVHKVGEIADLSEDRVELGGILVSGGAVLHPPEAVADHAWSLGTICPWRDRG
jgi:hypothetical protein